MVAHPSNIAVCKNLAGQHRSKISRFHATGSVSKCARMPHAGHPSRGHAMRWLFVFVSLAVGSLSQVDVVAGIRIIVSLRTVYFLRVDSRDQTGQHGTVTVGHIQSTACPIRAIMTGKLFHQLGAPCSLDGVSTSVAEGFALRNSASAG